MKVKQVMLYITALLIAVKNIYEMVIEYRQSKNPVP